MERLLDGALKVWIVAVADEQRGLAGDAIADLSHETSSGIGLVAVRDQIGIAVDLRDRHHPACAARSDSSAQLGQATPMPPVG